MATSSTRSETEAIVRVIRDADNAIHNTAGSLTEAATESEPFKIRFTSTTEILSTIAAKLDTSLSPSAAFPTEQTTTLVRALDLRLANARGTMRSFNSEGKQYDFYQSYIIELCDTLFNTIVDRTKVSSRRWDRSRKLMASGQTDFTGAYTLGLDGSTTRQIPLWEVKRSDHIPLRDILRLRHAASHGGIEIGIDADGSPTVSWPAGSDNVQAIDEMLCQLLVEFDAYNSSLLLFSNWDQYVVFHRIAADHVHMSEIILRDPKSIETDTTLSFYRMDIGIHGNLEWNAGLIVLGLLVAADDATFSGYRRPVERSIPKTIPGKRKSQSSGRRGGSSRQRTDVGESSMGNTESRGEGNSNNQQGSGQIDAEVDPDDSEEDDEVLTPASVNDQSTVLAIRFDIDLHRLVGHSLHDYLSRDWSRICWRVTDTSNSPPNGKVSAPPTTNDKVTLSSYISHGRLFDAFSAEYSGCDPSIPLVAKLVDLESFPSFSSSHDDSSSALAAAMTEVELYRHLSDIQGAVIPRLVNVWMGTSTSPWTGRKGRPAVVMLLTDVGEYAGQWTELNRASVLDLYDQIHRRGVVHNDIRARHIRRDRDGRLRLIDFEGAYRVSVESDACRRERELVTKLLDGEVKEENLCDAMLAV
nr:uncharacterized protein CI109_007388 [Kwoniella shandongensis]KAA5524265.1 hypothetical protein CI109_007388 [Kwoniella shandongensis]